MAKKRAVNKMNDVVTMVELTNEDDIKVFELEPTFRELGGGGSSALILTTDENFAIDHTNSEIVSAYDSGKTVILAVDHEGATVHESLVMYSTNGGMYVLLFGAGTDRTVASAADAYPVLN